MNFCLILVVFVSGDTNLAVFRVFKLEKEELTEEPEKEPNTNLEAAT